jgi:hypothetical protein
MPHPIERFRAPSSIVAGTPLKSLLGPTLVGLLGESFAAVVPGFDAGGFRAEAVRGLDELELMPRAAHLAAVLARRLASDPATAAAQVIAAMGPPLPATAGNGLRPFFYLPHSAWIAQHLPDHDAGMAACSALTRRFTAEFAIRPFLVRA